jgi:hypothetical protein
MMLVAGSGSCAVVGFGFRLVESSIYVMQELRYADSNSLQLNSSVRVSGNS